MRFLNRLMALLCLMAVAACGGGGGSAGTNPFPGDGSTPVPTATLTVAIDPPHVTATAPGTVTVTVKDASGVAIAGQLVTLATTVGQLDVSSVRTDSSGEGTATLSVNLAGSAGADNVTAAAVVGSNTLTALASYDVTATPTAPSVVEVVASSNKAGTEGGSITITAVVKGPGNVTIPATAVQFSTSTGTLTGASSTTDANGAATAQFGSGGDKSNRSALITVVAGSVTGTISIDVSGTTLSYLGSTTLTAGGASEAVTVTARDAKGSAIAGAALSVSSKLGNVAANTVVTTDSSGVARVLYLPTIAGADTLSVSGLGTSLSQEVTVIGQNFAFAAPLAGANVNIDTLSDIKVVYQGTEPADTVRFTTTAGTFSSGTVALVNGIGSTKISSTFAGPATLQATLFAAANPTVVVAQAKITLQFVATTPSSLTLQISPSSIGPTPPGSSVSQTTDVKASVIDQFSNPVANVTVNFSRTADPSGGNLSQPSAVTDSSGFATIQYISGAQSTPTNGVVIKASLASAPAISGTASLTVNQSALFIALGTNNEITNGDANNTTYLKLWTAYVTDATGAAVPNVTLTVSALPKTYGKGSFKWDGKQWSTALVSQTDVPAIYDSTKFVLPAGSSISCPSEDSFLGPDAPQTNNGVLDPGEDFNGDGKLEPGNVITVNSGPSVTTVKTDSTGFAIINLRYAESYAYWVELILKVTANVAGTESSNQAVFFAPGLTSDYTVETVAPAGAISPFGTQKNCVKPN